MNVPFVAGILDMEVCVPPPQHTHTLPQLFINQKYPEASAVRRCSLVSTNNRPTHARVDSGLACTHACTETAQKHERVSDFSRKCRRPPHLLSNVS